MIAPRKAAPPLDRDRIEQNEASVQCMARLKAGDDSALAELHRRWAKPLHRFLQGMCNDETLADDLVQEVFVRVWRAAPRYEPTAKYSTWLFHVARNHWLNEREKRLHRIRPVSLDRTGGDEDEPSMDAPDPQARTPAQHLLSKELGGRIERAVSRLPDKLRETWALAVTQGLQYPEVSEILGIPVGTVKSRMFQAVRLVREDLMPYLDKDKGSDHDVHRAGP
jgi:RNA polymerase sigma-70 factor (ECF subfamily)